MIGFFDLLKSAQEKFPRAARAPGMPDTAVDCGGVRVGGGSFAVVAGPCTVESHEQTLATALAVKKSGAKLLRGGAFKPRTSPYSFQGLREKGLDVLREVRAETGMGIVTEIMDARDLKLFDGIDVLQVGARNMQNYELLKTLGAETRRPVLIKRGFGNTVDELLTSAEYVLAGGNPNVILCERGIRTFETATRYTPDLVAVQLLRRLTHLPVIVDPSHAAGAAEFVPGVSAGAAAMGADGLIVEVHVRPQEARCDGPQALTPEQFADMMERVGKIAPLACK